MVLPTVELEARGLFVVPTGDDEDYETLLYTPAAAYGVPRQLHLDGCGLDRPFLLLGGEGLQQVHLQKNGLSMPPQLGSCICLQVLDLSRNLLHDVSALSPLTQLQVLLLGRNQLQDLQQLTPLTSLEVLDIHRNGVSDLTPLTCLRRLRLLHASHNQLAQLPDLSPCSSLQELNLRRNQLAALTCLRVLSAAAEGGQVAQDELPHAMELVSSTMTATARKKATASGSTAVAAAAPAEEGTATAKLAASSGVLLGTASSAHHGASSSSSSSHAVPRLALPMSIQHLLLDHNHLPRLDSLGALTQLTNLVTLSVTGNPAMLLENMPQGVKPREGLLLCCPVGLTVLNEEQVSAEDRMIILGAAHRRRLLHLQQHGAAAEVGTGTLPGPLSKQQQQRSTVSGSAGAPHSTTAAAAAAAAAGPAAAAPHPAPATGPSSNQPGGVQPLAQEGAGSGSVEEPAMEMLDSHRATQGKAALQQKTTWQEEGTLTAVLRQLGKCSTMDRQQDPLEEQATLSSSTTGALQQTHHHQQQQHGSTVKAAATHLLGSRGRHQASPSTSPLDSGRLMELGSGRSQDLPVADSTVTQVPVTISKPELEQNYLMTEGLLLGTRGPTTAAERVPFRPGVMYDGIILSITGEAALSAVYSPVYAGIQELRLVDIPISKVLASWDAVVALPRLSRLQLCANRITSLCQLHPLLQLPLLKQVVLQDNPVCQLVLLRPYVAFRFPQMQMFNGEPITVGDQEQGLQIFSPLEAAMQSALAQPPQRAVLGAAGIPLPLTPTTSATAARRSMGGRRSAAGALLTAAPVVTAALGPSLWSALAPGTAPTVPPKHQAAGEAFVEDLLQRAAEVQEQLAVLQDAWPAAADQLVQDGWQGLYVLPDN